MTTHICRNRGSTSAFDKALDEDLKSGVVICPLSSTKQLHCKRIASLKERGSQMYALVITDARTRWIKENVLICYLHY